MIDKSCEFKETCLLYKPKSIVCLQYSNVCSRYHYFKCGYKEPLYKYHGDEPKLFEYDEDNGIVDVFVYRDNPCPYPFTITNTDDPWYHQGFYLNEFIDRLKEFLSKNNLPYFIQKKREKKK